ncbi:hypothetical protein [Streptomyces fuscichromogenes]|uniref:Uncharacterized protein n=1 Tax=Streptomyces fuscichromogenes TaxID=1324013 RepID=A0A918CW50_9ACTN|nr:hypothetical protein [Streptomyces fuscichromogenes]GGN38150.1 hypothetical protein GCM10011578_083220 [Streptomyces fuscichromogenes]
MATTAAQDIKNRAVTLNGQTAAVNLVGGQTLTGTLDYATVAVEWGGTDYPESLQITVDTIVHTVRLDHVSSVGSDFIVVDEDDDGEG